MFYECAAVYSYITPENFGDIQLRETRAMIVKIAQKERRLAANNAWGPATAIWVYALTKGVKDVTPEQFNPFLETSKSDNNGLGISSRGRTLAWMSKETALGIVNAAEKKLLSTAFWFKIVGIWYDIVATSER